MNADPAAAPIGETAFTALDFESAGARPGATDEPVQIAWACMAGVKILPDTFFTSYLRAESAITWAAARVHGITRGHLDGAPVLSALWPQIRRAMAGRVLVAHGAGTERRFLRAFPLHGLGPWVDTLPLARAVCPGLADHSIGSVIAHLGLAAELDALCPGLHWHHALYDSVACLVFLRRLIHSAGLAEQPLHVLQHPDPAAYYRTRAIKP